MSKSEFVPLPVCDITVYESIMQVDNQCHMQYNVRAVELEEFDDLSVSAEVLIYA
jgi:hypothetical protein